MQMTLLSIFTPTNNPQWLGDCYTSLCAQTYPQWEWVLVPNGSVEVPAYIAKSANVRVVPFQDATSSIGELKRFACNACKGDVFVELDHDDMLAPTVLERIAAESADAGFIYSDAALFKEGSLEPVTFSQEFGWETYSTDIFGHTFTATKAFPLSARSLCEIFFAPDHVRAWRRDAYERTGGHDIALAVGDDHDLVCRTYLAGIPFKHLGCCGYLYRTHDKNNVFLRNEEIQTQQATNRLKYTHLLIAEWCRRQSLTIVDLCECLQAPDAFAATIKLLTSFPDSSVGWIKTSDLLQLVPSHLVSDIVNALFRVLLPGGWLSAAVPSTDGRGAWQDHRHRSFWNENSWQYFCDDSLRVFYPQLTARFQNVQSGTEYPSDWHEQRKILYTWSDLCALKGQRQPGSGVWIP